MRHVRKCRWYQWRLHSEGKKEMTDDTNLLKQHRCQKTKERKKGRKGGRKEGREEGRKERKKERFIK